MNRSIPTTLAVLLSLAVACSAPRDPRRDESPDASTGGNNGGSGTDAGTPPAGPPVPSCSAGADGGVSCTCPDGWLVGSPTLCADIDECTNDNGGCSKHAGCANLPGSFVCGCDKGYEGDGKTCTLIGGGHQVGVDPSAIDFGTVAVGLARERTLVVSNTGMNDSEAVPDDLVVSEVEAPAGVSVAWPEGTELPVHVPQGTTLTAVVRLTAAAAGPFTGVLRIHSNDVVNPIVEVALQADAVDAAGCTYQLDPASDLPFGLVPQGTRASRDVTLANTGSAPCLVEGLALATGSSPAFATSAPVSPDTVLAPGATLALTVTLSVPTTAADGDAYAGSLQLSMAATASPSATILLSGRAGIPCLQLSPTTLDFGALAPNCGSDPMHVVLTNGCARDLHVQTAATGTISPFTLGPATYPALVPAGASLTLDVSYRPSGAGADSGTLAITTDEAATGGLPYTVPLRGSGAAGSTRTEHFHQAIATDLLLVVDDSGSMDPEQQILATKLPTLVQQAVAKGADFHIAVTTTSATAGDPSCNDPSTANGRFFPFTGPDRIVTPATADPGAAIARNVAVGSNGCATEQGLEGAYEALSAPNVTGTNAGFLRPDARLAIVIVSDTDDQSPKAVDTYRQFFQGLKPANPGLVTVSVIGDIDESVCAANNASPEGGGAANYLQLVTATGGLSANICDADWAPDLQRIADLAFANGTVFPLADTPQNGAVTVTVNGNPVTSGFTYDAATNSVRFDPASAPASGADVVVSYAPVCR